MRSKLRHSNRKTPKLQTAQDSMIYQPPRVGMYFIFGCILLLFAVIVFRFWYLQILHGEELTSRAFSTHRTRERIQAGRGLIFDRNGIVLAENSSTYALGIVPESCFNIMATIAQISSWTNEPFTPILNRYFKEVNDKNSRRFEPKIVVRELTATQHALVENQLHKWPGLVVLPVPKRNYPHKELFAHVIGYVGEANPEHLQTDKEYRQLTMDDISREELDRFDTDLLGLRSGDSFGRSGLESSKEYVLRGKQGLAVFVTNNRGRKLQSNIVSFSVNGNDLRLSLDVDIQKGAYEALGDYCGAIVVMEPQSGKLLALVSKASFDPNLLIGGISQKQWAILDDPALSPLINRSIQSHYPPGSVWKLGMVGLFLKEGIAPSEIVFCPGFYKLGNQVFKCWRGTGHGKVNMVRSLVESCDVYYYTMADRIGIDKITAFMKQCGFGERTGIDLPNERSGLVPSKEWKFLRRNEGWQRGETLNTSIGQGSTLVSPVQMAVFVSSLLNGGILYQPSFLQDEEPVIKSFAPIKEEHRDFLIDAMLQTVYGPGGTARSLKRLDMEVGGKTGTAQVVSLRMIGNRRARNDEVPREQRDHAWIASWGKKDGQEVVVIVFVEHGGGGASVAGPITRKVYEVIFPLDNNNKQ